MEKIAKVPAGWLIVKSFERMYREFGRPSHPGEPAVYSIPHMDLDAGSMLKKYRGISRDALEAWTQEEMESGYPNIPTPIERAACVAIAELEMNGKAAEDFIFPAADAVRVFRLLREPSAWELIWACQSDPDVERPAGTLLLGYEPTWWIGDHFSAVMDSMCFPRWHGPDPEGTLLEGFHAQLNRHALFASATDASAFLDFYRSQRWAETGTYVIAEVRGSG